MTDDDQGRVSKCCGRGRQRPRNFVDDLYKILVKYANLGLFAQSMSYQ
jgi:hypothetical protein